MSLILNESPVLSTFSCASHWPPPSFGEFELLHEVRNPHDPAKRIPAMPAGAILLDPQRILGLDGFDNLPAGFRLLRLSVNLELSPQEGFLA